MACGVGAFTLALLPLLLQNFHSPWRPGVQVSRADTGAATSRALATWKVPVHASG